jgi:hypothetical protein
MRNWPVGSGKIRTRRETRTRNERKMTEKENARPKVERASSEVPTLRSGGRVA